VWVLLGDNPKAELDPQVKERARLEYMRLNAVLAILDADRNGEISAGEVKNSSFALRALDMNRDGSLTPEEVLPERVDNRTATILSRLDTNRDYQLSQQEQAAEEAMPLRELLDRADRNGDGVITAAELTKELQFRDELKKQMEKATRSNGLANPLQRR
jgi:Ca2+-binding EF-hand superfamily protein